MAKMIRIKEAKKKINNYKYDVANEIG
jgi:hypothetical protein